jgi:hypothetical protein
MTLGIFLGELFRWAIVVRSAELFGCKVTEQDVSVLVLWPLALLTEV